MRKNGGVADRGSRMLLVTGFILLWFVYVWATRSRSTENCDLGLVASVARRADFADRVDFRNWGKSGRSDDLAETPKMSQRLASPKRAGASTPYQRTIVVFQRAKSFDCRNGGTQFVKVPEILRLAGLFYLK
jgi:hypothetical protein